MVPPKKDAFADIFQSATSSNSSIDRKKNLSDLQKSKVNDGLTSNLNNMSLNGSRPNVSQSNNSNWDQFDIFNTSSASSNVSGSKNGSRVETPLNDPFDIFNDLPSKPSPPPQQTPQQTTHSINSIAPQSGNGGNLLDDEFTDAFHPEPVSQPIIEPKPVQPTFEPESSIQYSSTSRPTSRPTPRPRSNEKKDALIAQLIEIGFTDDVANNAIDEVGMDLQACVNFIMSGGKSRPNSNQPRRDESPKDLNFNEISNDLFNKASSFFNKSKKTVMKNIEQFQQSQNFNGFGGYNNKKDNSVPAWMRNQEKYKSQASERNPNGEDFEDYGDDEDNIDHEAIKHFMEAQRLKDKERNKARYDQLKSKINGRSPSPQKPSVQSNPPLQPSSRVHTPVQRPSPTPELKHESIPTPKSSTPQQSIPQAKEADLLGLNEGLSRAQKFKAQASDDITYVSSRRRKPASSPSPSMASTQKVPRKTTKQPLDQFSQSDYETGKEKATKSFSNGDYDDAFLNYTKCLNVLPSTHELRIVILSNLSITLIKLGNYKTARDHCDEGLSLISKEELSDTSYLINERPIKSWYTKLLARKAEALEMMESFIDSLECYMELIRLGVNDKKVMDAKRRVNNIVNPPPKKAKPVPVSKSTSVSSSNETVNRVKEQNRKQQERESQKSQLYDEVHSKVFAWSNGKEDNLRTLLIGLPDILPQSLGFPFLTTKKISLNDLMLPKKVKINYMKVISSIHPDKLNNLNLKVEEEMLCQSVFITLNKSWDIFKEQNGIN
ncbi:auxilin-like clathrin uncoating factor Swa2p [[Candida] jaroonii]|uniref:Auxilin-like clathrin uncoating factor Swa2p n=1 Tax=[Candida] jaroonii TaxID=467808 RepID=A0ACA9YBS5_9ASCO|nr:auxilin-like clathrin uncoating factor Swa2p [[Candida] jaroonii]